MSVTEGLPVALDLPDHLAREVAAWAESEAGWHVVGVAGPPLPAMVLATSIGAHSRCVVVVDGEPTPDQVRAALQAGALDVVGWPSQRVRLQDAAVAAVTAGNVGSGPSVFRIGGTAGGAGTSTISLAIGGLLAWSGLRTLVVGDGDLTALCGEADWQGPGSGELSALRPDDAAAEFGGVVRPVPGVSGLSVLGGGGDAVGSTAGWPVDVVVADVRAAAPPWHVDLLVTRPDASARLAFDTPVPVLVGRAGALDRAGVRKAMGRAPAGWMPESARVARAGLQGRVPASLPGSWLRVLGSALRDLRRPAGARS